MPDKRAHRGAHPQDARLFREELHPRLRRAVEELSWLLSRGYSEVAARTLVGDHHQLQKRQRKALGRMACSDQSLHLRREKLVPVQGAQVIVDGFNQLVGVEALLGGAVLLRGRDGVIRDLASVHGTWRRVAETRRALELLAEQLEPAASVRWLFDAPVSNSGRAAAMVRELGMEAEVVGDVDRALIESGLAVASSDGPVLDRSAARVDLLNPLVAQLTARVVE